MNYETRQLVGTLAIVLAITAAITIIWTTTIVESQRTERVKFVAGYEQVVDTTRVSSPAYTSPMWKKAK